MKGIEASGRPCYILEKLPGTRDSSRPDEKPPVNRQSYEGRGEDEQDRGIRGSISTTDRADRRELTTCMKTAKIFSLFLGLSLSVIPARVFGQVYRDGVWAGESRREPYMVELELVVEEGRIKEINYLSLPDWETETVKAEMRRQVLSRQSAKIEAVTGATASCEMIAEAVGQALAKARLAPAPASTPPSAAGTSRVPNGPSNLPSQK